MPNFPHLNGTTAPPVLDDEAQWAAMTPGEQLGEILSTFAVEDWLVEPALSVLAAHRPQPLVWARVAIRWSQRAHLPLSILEQAIDAWQQVLGGDTATTKRGAGRPRLPRPPLLPSLPEG